MLNLVLTSLELSLETLHHGIVNSSSWCELNKVDVQIHKQEKSPGALVDISSPAWTSTWPTNGWGWWERAASSLGGCVLVLVSKPSPVLALSVLGRGEV